MRRRRRTTAVVACTAVLAGGVGWATQPWDAFPTTVVEPAAVLPYVPSDASSDTPSDADAGTHEEQPDAPYWHVRTEAWSTDSTGAEHHEVRDTWSSENHPGLYVVEGAPSETGSFGPRAWGELVLAGERVALDRARLDGLPTDPVALEAVLRDSVEPDRRAGTPDDKVFEMAYELLAGTPASSDLRDALWSVMTGLPGSTTLGTGTDALDRAGEGVERVVDGWTTRALYDPTGHRLLETSGALSDDLLDQLRESGQLDGVIMSTSTRTVYVDEGPADAPPSEPLLEDSGCVDWATC